MSTKEENKADECLQNDKQTLETSTFSGQHSKILTGGRTTTDRDTPNANGDHESERKGQIEPNSSDETGDKQDIKESKRKYEDKILAEVVQLLRRPVFPDEDDSDEMSRLASKAKVPSKSISRPSLSHVNSKMPGELSGQPSVRNTKEDAKYWKSREQELLDRIAALESKAAKAETAKEKFHGPLDQVASQIQEKLEEDLSATAKEKENYKNRLQQIEKELFVKQQSTEPNLRSMKNPDEIINYLKAQNEDLRGALAKMTAILKDKTTLCVTQEKKIAALTNQVESLKEVVAITKDLLNIRNMEVQHISNDISAMETKIDCERQRHNQMLIKMDEAVKLNSELKKEYENQMKLFQHLRDNYEEKIRMMSQSNPPEEQALDQLDQQRNSNGNVKATQVVSKSSKASNGKVNFQDS